MSVNYGSKRVVVGAGYGMRDWLSQRATAVVMALFTLSLFGCNTVKGVGRDVEKVGEKIEDAGRR